MDEPLEKIVAGTFDMAEFAKQMEEEIKAKDERRRRLIAKREELNKNVSVMTDQIESDPNNPELYVKRAQTYLGESYSNRLGYNPRDLENAIADYKKALELSPGSVSILEQIEFFDAMQSQNDKRVEKLKIFANKYPQSIRRPFALYSLAYYAEKANNLEEALEYIFEAEKAEVGGHFSSSLSNVRKRLESKLAIQQRLPE